MKKVFFTILLTLIISSITLAQLKYSFSSSTGSYIPLSTWNTFTWIASGTDPLDESYSSPTPIGFTFVYNGVPFDSFQVSTNGFIRLGSGLTSATFTNSLWGTTRNVIAPLWDDQAVLDSLGNITYNVSGSAPNRVLTVQWRNMKWLYNDPTANANYQVKLYESTGEIEFIYGTFGTTTTTRTASIGINDGTPITSSTQSTGTYISVNVGGAPGARVYHLSMGFEFNGNAQSMDANTVLKFTPMGTTTPIPGGTYTVGGTSPDFPSLSQAAMALNQRGISGAVVLNVRSGTYDDVFHLINVAGTSPTNTITLKRESGTVTLSPRNGSQTSTAPTTTSGDAVIRLDGTQFVTIDGINIVDNSLNTTTATKFEVGIFLANSIVTTASGSVIRGARFNVLKNLNINMQGATPVVNVGATGIRYGTNGTSVDTSHSNSYNVIQDVNISNCFRSAIRMFGFSGTNPDRGNIITASLGRNTIGNFTVSSSASDTRQIEIDCQFDFTIEKTDIVNVINNGATTQNVYGIWLNPAASTVNLNGGVLTFRDIRISNLQNTATGVTTGSTIGLQVNNVLPGTIINISNLNIYDFFSNGNSTATCRGIVIAVGTTTGFVVANIYNNFISDLRAPRSTAGPSVRGLDLQFANRINVYYNTIYLDGTVTSTTHQSSGIYLANVSTSTIDLRNNIVVNVMGTTTRAVALYATSTANLQRLASTTNNNLYFAGTPGTTRLIAYDGTNSYQTLATYRSGLGGGRELNSITENPPFVNVTTKPYDLHIKTDVATRVESGGQAIAGYTLDFDGNTRHSTFPDIGADEFTGIATDENPPLIIYTPLPNDRNTVSRTITVTILDPSGIATGANAPRLYYKKSTQTSYVFDNQPTVSGNSYTFTFDYSNIGGVSYGDIIQYYVAAQDQNGYVITNPPGGSGSNPPGSTAPSTPNSYVIPNEALSGNYTVGLNLFNKVTGKEIYFEKITEKVIEKVWVEDQKISQNSVQKDIYGNDIETLPVPNGKYELLEIEKVTYIPMENGRKYEGKLYVKRHENPDLNLPKGIEGVYATLTAAINDLNQRGVSGPVTFLLTDTLYSTGETFPLIINVNIDKPTSTNPVTIRPQSGIVTKISSSVPNNQIFRILTDYITIDGSNSGSIDRSLTIENTSTTSPSVVLIGSTGFTPITNVTLKNCIIINGTNGATPVYVSDGSILANFGYFNNISIINNDIRRSYIGIYAIADPSTPNNGSGLNISNNDLTNSGALAIRLVGIYVQGVSGALISNNLIGNFSTLDSTANISGIWLAAGTTNTTVTSNSISNIISTLTNRGAGRGIAVSSGQPNANIQIINNSINTVTANFTSPPYGIYVFGTTGNVEISRNSVTNIRNDYAATGARGIYIFTNLPSSNTLIHNNSVSQVRVLSGTTISTGGIGIGIDGTTGGVGIYYNSVNLFDSFAGFNEATIHTAMALVSTGHININISNNIFVNTLDNTTTTTDKSYAINIQSPAYSLVDINYNNYYVSGSAGVLGFLVTDRTSLDSWKSATGKDLYSLSGDPAFTSNTNLLPNHNNINSWNVANKGIHIPSINVDITGAPRPTIATAGVPDLGAYEFPNPTVAPPSGTQTGTIGSGSTTTYMQGGRPIGAITWGTTGTFPSSVTFRYYSGIAPTGPGTRARQYWEITATGGEGFTYNITLNYDEAQLNGINENDIHPAKSEDGINWQGFFTQGTSPGQFQRNTEANTITIFGLTSFSFFGLSDQNDPLPLELSSFTARVKERDVVLDWVTISETNLKGFEIERKLINDIDKTREKWLKIDFVEANGNSNKPINYNYTDKKLNTGKYAYRLKMIDIDGSFNYSDEVRIEIGKPVITELKQNYPNTFNPETKIEYQLSNPSKVKIEVYSITGEFITTLVDKELDAGYYVEIFNANNIKGGLASGVYIYRMIANDLVTGQRIIQTKKMMLIK